MRGILATILLGAALHAGAAPFAVSVGGERLVLDAVPGLSDALPLGSPRIQEFAESLTSASNRILVFALTDADIRRFTQGDAADLKRYMLLTTPNYLANERVSTAQFRRLIEDAQRDTGKPAEVADIQKFLDERPRGQTTTLGQLRLTDNTYSVLVGARLPGDEGWFSKPKYLISSFTVLLVRNKALQLQVYSSPEEGLDMEWIRFVTERWIETLQRLNTR